MSGGQAMGQGGLPRVAILFTQFAPYHLDRIEAAARRLVGRAEIVAIECSSSSDTYDWEPPRAIAGVEQITLFPGRIFETLGWRERYPAWRRATEGAELVLTGVPYSAPDMIALAWARRREGLRIIAMTCSKADDAPRGALREWAKARLLGGFSGAMVAGTRSRDYLRGLGFAGKPMLPGYNTMNMARIRAQAESAGLVPWAERPFVFVGRLVGKKNLPRLIEAYVRYAQQAGEGARALVLVGKGPLEDSLRAQVAQLGLEEQISFAGHVDSVGVARQLASALALVLVSREEQWGLVVNEAVALGIPVIASSAVGACDALVREGVTGRVVEAGSTEDIAAALQVLATDEPHWQAMSNASAERSWFADAERFADAVELLLDPTSDGAAANVARFWSGCEVH